MSSTLQFHWFLPTYGDSRYIVGGGHGLPAGIAGGARPATLAYLGQIARSAEQLGYVGALTPTGAWCEDAFVVDSMFASEVTESFVLIAIRPGLISPTLAAQMAASFQRFSFQRTSPAQCRGGRRTARTARLRRFCRTRLEALRTLQTNFSRSSALWDRPNVNFKGRFLPSRECHAAVAPRSAAAALYRRFLRRGRSRHRAPHRCIFPPGANRSTPAIVEKNHSGVRALAAAEGRTVRFGIRLHVITRDTAEAAWAEAHRLLAAIDPETITRSGQSANRPCAQRRRGTGETHARPARWFGREPRNLNPPFGPASIWFAAALAPLSSAATWRSPRKSKRTPPSASDEFVLSGVPLIWSEAYWFAEGVLGRFCARRGCGVIRVAKRNPAATSTFRFRRPPPVNPSLRRVELNLSSPVTTSIASIARIISSDREALAAAREVAALLAPEASARDRERRKPVAELDLLSARGLLALTVPRAHGGADVSTEILAQGFPNPCCRRSGQAVAQLPQSHFVFSLNALREDGSEEQQQFFFSEVLAGARLGNASGRTRFHLRARSQDRPVFAALAPIMCSTAPNTIPPEHFSPIGCR